MKRAFLLGIISLFIGCSTPNEDSNTTNNQITTINENSNISDNEQITMSENSNTTNNQATITSEDFDTINDVNLTVYEFENNLSKVLSSLEKNNLSNGISSFGLTYDLIDINVTSLATVLKEKNITNISDLMKNYKIIDAVNVNGKDINISAVIETFNILKNVNSFKESYKNLLELDETPKTFFVYRDNKKEDFKENGDVEYNIFDFENFEVIKDSEAKWALIKGIIVLKDDKYKYLGVKNSDDVVKKLIIYDTNNTVNKEIILNERLEDVVFDSYEKINEILGESTYNEFNIQYNIPYIASLDKYVTLKFNGESNVIINGQIYAYELLDDNKTTIVIKDYELDKDIYIYNIRDNIRNNAYFVFVNRLESDYNKVSFINRNLFMKKEAVNKSNLEAYSNYYKQENISLNEIANKTFIFGPSIESNGTLKTISFDENGESNITAYNGTTQVNLEFYEASIDDKNIKVTFNNNKSYYFQKVDGDENGLILLPEDGFNDNHHYEFWTLLNKQEDINISLLVKQKYRLNLYTLDTNNSYNFNSIKLSLFNNNTWKYSEMENNIYINGKYEINGINNVLLKDLDDNEVFRLEFIGHIGDFYIAKWFDYNQDKYISTTAFSTKPILKGE